MRNQEHITSVGAKPIPHVRRMSAQYKANIKEVLWLTGMCDDELRNLMIDTGTTWLRQFAKDIYAIPADQITDILIMPEMYQWWYNEWCRRDHAQNLQLLYTMPDDERLARYRAMHQEIFIRWKPEFSDMLDGFLVTLKEVLP